MKKLRNINFRRTFAGVAAASAFLGILMTVVGAFIATRPVSAQDVPRPTTFDWINVGSLRTSTGTYQDSDPFDGTREFINTAAGTCTSPQNGRTDIPRDRIILNSDSQGGLFIIRTGPDANGYKYTAADGSSLCESLPQTNITATPATLPNAQSRFYRVGDTVTTWDGKNSFVKTSANPGPTIRGTTNLEIFTRSTEIGSQPCPDVIIHGTDGEYNGWFIFPMAPKGQGNAYDGIVSERYQELGFPNANANCNVSGDLATDLHVGAAYSAPGSPIPGVTGFSVIPSVFGDDLYSITSGVQTLTQDQAANLPQVNSNASNQPVKKTACDASWGNVDLISLKWFVCPIINIMLRTVGLLEDFLVQQLTIDMTPLDPKGPYHKVWASIRTIALGMVVIIALIMVIFEAAGIEAFSAYTIRKSFGRLFVLLIFIVLSWSLFTEITRIINWIIEGIQTLIYAPFNAAFGNKELVTKGASQILGLLGAGAIIAFGPWGLLSFVLSALLSIGVTVLIITLAHAAWYTLGMFAPFFIACEMLENTKGIGEFGKSAATSVGAGLIGAAGVMSLLDVMADSTGQIQDGTISILFVFLAFAMKLGRVFAVAWVFSQVKGVVSSFTGGAKGILGKAQEGVRGFRGRQLKKNVTDMGTGERFKGNNFMSRGFNAATRGATNFAKSDNKRAMLGLARPSNVRNAWSAAGEQAAAINAAKYAKSDAAQVSQHNDGLLRAQTYRNENEARQRMATDWKMDQKDVERAITQAKTNGGFSATRQQHATRQLARTGTGYDNLKQLHSTVARVAGGNEDMANSLLGGINSDTKGAGRFDLATGHGYQMELYRAQRDLNAGRISQQSYDAQISEGYVKAFKGAKSHELMGSKAIAQDNVMPAVSNAIYTAQRDIGSADLSTDSGRALHTQASEEYGRLLTGMDNLNKAKAYAAPDAAQRFDQGGYRPTRPERDDMSDRMHQEMPGSRDAAGNVIVNQGAVDAFGNVLLDRQGNEIPLQNPDYNPGVVRGNQEQESGMPYNPRDPRNP